MKNSNRKFIHTLEQFLVKLLPKKVYRMLGFLYEFIKSKKSYSQYGEDLIINAYFQSIGKPKQALWLTLYRQGLFMIPLVMILPTFMGIKGIWFSFPIGESLATLVSFFWLKKNLKFLAINA